MRRAVIFDMDGVLVDSCPLIWDSFIVAAREQELNVSGESMKDYLGISIQDCLTRWKKAYGVQLKFKRFRATACEYQNTHLGDKDLAVPGVKEFLNTLKANGIRMAVGTSSHEERARFYLEPTKLAHYFDAIVTSTRVPNHKPFPDIFLRAATELGVAPGKCIVIEDAPIGIEAAHRAGMKAIGITTPPSTKELLQSADIVIGGFSELSVERVLSFI
ncbi:MAG: HAD family phosphatase [Candidatus Diapherotrites archaeon]|nr:HAD family phosphatase [Candidatus Diapherotrites archaeon]